MEAPKTMLLIFLLLFSDIFVSKSLSEGVTPEEAKELRDEVIKFMCHALATLLHRSHLRTDFNSSRILILVSIKLWLHN